MSKRVLCLLVDGFEEIETITPVDLLRRAGVEVVLAALVRKQITGRCAMTLVADVLLDEIETDGFDALFIPGGPGVGELREDGRAIALARNFSDQGKQVAAICAAPLILKDAELLYGKRFTAHSSVHADLPGVIDEKVVIDGNLITSRGAGTAQDFAFALVEILAGENALRDVRAAIMA